jgi:hypothetical protein
VNYQSIARRYLPLAAVVAVQLLIIAVVPSKANTPSSNVGVASGPVQGFSNGGGSAGGASLGTSSATIGGAAGTAGAVGGASGAGSTSGASGGTASASSGGSGTSGAGGATGSGAAANANDTSHCAGNREYSPAIDFYAPPCTPGPVGASGYNNGGATYQGVSKSAITLVDYVTNYGAETNTILQAEGLLETYQQATVVDKAWQNFINSHYVLWGRQIHIVTYQGQCQSVPPDYSCLEAEMNTIVSTYHPYAVLWETTLCSACFQTLASDHVIAFGGEGFSDAFTNANAPYVYSGYESSTHIEKAFANWYCNQMKGPVAFAPDKNPAQNFSGQPRVLGVISTNDPDNENTVNNALVPALKACGVSVNHFYFYSQDINTAAQQVEAGISAMDTTTNPATDVLCLCDPVAPEFLYSGEEQHNYWPENLLADAQLMTLDSASQNYEAGSNNSSSLACPAPNVGCEYNDAFGITSVGPQDPQTNNAGVRTFKLGGGTSLPISGGQADTVWEDYNMLASLIENTGPDLTPARMQAAAPTMGSIGGGTTNRPRVGFSAGNYNWTQDAEVAYWDPNRTSTYDGQPGTMVPIEGSRFLIGQFPKASEPPIPATRS